MVKCERAVILAGGAGARLAPETASVPKPLVRIGDGPPLLEILLGQLARAGFGRVTIAVHHLAEQVVRLVDESPRSGLIIDCSLEDRPLGTAGPLTLLADLPPDFLVMNGDVLCDLDLGAFMAAHRAAGNDLTLATCRRTFALDVGVVSFDEQRRLLAFSERPAHAHDVNMGIYAVKRDLVGRLPAGQRIGFDQVIEEALARGDRVGVHPFSGYWLDVGSPADRERANAAWPALRARLLG